MQNFIAIHEDRFQNLDTVHSSGDRIINNRAGWIKGGDYFFIPKAFDEAIDGTDPKIARRLLKECGLLHAPNKGRYTMTLRTNGGTRGVIHIGSDVFTAHTAHSENMRRANVCSVCSVNNLLHTPQTRMVEGLCAECALCAVETTVRAARTD